MVLTKSALIEKEEEDPNESKLIPKFEVYFNLQTFRVGLVDNHQNEIGMVVELNTLELHLKAYDSLNYHNVNSIELTTKLLNL